MLQSVQLLLVLLLIPSNNGIIKYSVLIEKCFGQGPVPFCHVHADYQKFITIVHSCRCCSLGCCCRIMYEPPMLFGMTSARLAEELQKKYNTLPEVGHRLRRCR